MNFTENVLSVVSKIPRGTVMTYAEVARAIGIPSSARAVGTVMRKNRDPKIPCFRVVRSDRTIGEYNQGARKKKNLLRQEGSVDAHGYVRRYETRGNYINYDQAIRILQDGGVGVVPTDTLYGIVCRAKDKEAVLKVYHTRKRNMTKPCIILIENIEDMRLFGVRLTADIQKISKAIWPGMVSVIVPCENERWTYLHRGSRTLAFRIPKNEDIRAILHETGPLIAPSANFEGRPSCKTIEEAKKVFKDSVDLYVDGGRLEGRGSTLIAYEKDDIVLKREGKVLFADIANTLKKYLV